MDTDEPVSPVRLDIDLNTFTIAEVETLEDYAGVPFTKVPDLLKEGASGKVLRALAFIGLRRANPEATWDEAGAIKITDLFDRAGSGGALPPPPPPASAS